MPDVQLQLRARSVVDADDFHIAQPDRVPTQFSVVIRAGQVTVV